MSAATPRVVVDPITRIEGHLRIEAETDADNRIVNAYSAGTMVRGIEIILRGRDPRDAWAFAQRICGVCTLVHGIASVRAVEDALKYEIPANAQLIRNLMIGAQYVHDHVMHFYHLHALDWVDVVSALAADPAATSTLAQSLSSYPSSSPGYFADVQKRLKTFVEGGQLGIFANGYWGHPAYKLPPEANLMAVAHYLDALAWQRDVAQLHTIFGGKNPHPHFLVGGVPNPIDLNSDSAINSKRLAQVQDIITRMREFVDQVYVPDTLAIAGFYKDWAAQGEGLGNFMCYGDFPAHGMNDPKSFLIPRGVILDRDLSTIHEVDLHDAGQIQEYVSHAWYDYDGGKDEGLHPYDGETRLNYTGPQPPYQYLDVEKQLLLAQVAALEGQGHGGRPARADADAVRDGQCAGEGTGRLDAREARRADAGAVLDARPHRGAHARDQDLRRRDAGLVRPADRQHQGRRYPHLQREAVGALHVAETGPRGWLHGSAARRARPLDRHRGRQDRQLPGGRAEHLECGAARPAGPAGRLRGGAASVTSCTTRSSRSRSCAPSTASTRASPARCTCPGRAGPARACRSRSAGPDAG